MTESISWDGHHLDVKVDGSQPLRACGTTMTHNADGLTDDNGHALAYVHLREHVAAFAALHIIHDLHAPNPEGLVPWCPVCSTPSPCQTRRVTVAAYEVQV